ncbi:protein phosphatase 1 regulatory subunit 14b [Biomphalaria glabrata]|uniref:Uncharacterized protein LOC106051671 isoform X1 n=1 Tax=Biomphalaria glabrata TaxID=6526 RepID=A0A2C9LPC9_BIOGL|nr:uncharacterized protein LOC106051671 isoform X1 [Biomphalaria glabrata]XP_013062330.1 uncharacterized protein LOC106051671 isoform X1 [Biomphalaria glabrata]KAI8735382.1 protein phosphatase 1 regulatory subunit 14B [Biomphalaria glabrata]KAI8784663.1 protein phosphatase 1 regulatory subunit 14B [Biomphalaria glabrata]
MSRNPFRKSVGFYEVRSSRPMATSFSSSTSSSEPGFLKPIQMENIDSPTQESPKNVGFSNIKEQHTEKKKKYLTAKYGAHQMLLIKKRLNVEMWIFDELRRLYNSVTDDHDCDLDLEEILNLDEDNERRKYIMQCLQDAKQSPEEIHNFAEELLRRAKTL